MPKTLKAVQPNAGIELAYRKELSKLIAQMAGSCEYWLEAAYKRDPPRTAELVEVAQDARVGKHAKRSQQYASSTGPVANIQKVLDNLGKRWQGRFDELAPKIAESYMQQMFKASDSAFMRNLKDAGFAVQFTMTPAVRDAFNASLEENIGLIKSIPEKYLQRVQGSVMRSYSTGRDLHAMVQDIKQIYPKAADRAVLIARDQSNKANAVVNRTREMELGITEAKWMHSHAGKEPRPDHVAADGKIYKIAQGCYISGEYIQPGQEINCRCTHRPILPF